ncbi:MAG: hypothetical protein Hyperionvirus48_8, partial [Hyperionvirus sp.]
MLNRWENNDPPFIPPPLLFGTLPPFMENYTTLGPQKFEVTDGFRIYSHKK